MADPTTEIKFQEGLVFPKGQCPKHGTVEIFTVKGHNGGVVYAELNLCPKCYIEWIGANVTTVEPSDV